VTPLDLAPGAPGGLREDLDAGAVTGVDPALVRVATLDRPASKADLLDQLATGLGLPAWFGRNWDALEEILRSPAPADDRAIVVVWHDQERLDRDDRAAARSVFAAAAADRAARGRRPLIIVMAGGRPKATERTGERAKEPTMTDPARRVPQAIRRMGKIHHVALIVRSIDDALGLWRDLFGLELETIMDIPSDRVRIAFLTVGESKVELVEPSDDTTGVARFLAAKGEGFHHVCFEVPNLAETLLRLEIDGLELIDSAPRRGAEGPVAFIHPRSCHGVLVELIEAPGGPAWASLGF
jgi:methylmalonyl-CoA epimerase